MDPKLLSSLPECLIGVSTETLSLGSLWLLPSLFYSLILSLLSEASRSFYS